MWDTDFIDLTRKLITSRQIDGKTVETIDFTFLGSKNSANGEYSYENKTLLLFEKKKTKTITKLDIIIENKDNFANKSIASPKKSFSSNHIWMWEFDY